MGLLCSRNARPRKPLARGNGTSRCASEVGGLKKLRARLGKRHATPPIPEEEGMKGSIW